MSSVYIKPKTLRKARSPLHAHLLDTIVPLLSFPGLPKVTVNVDSPSSIYIAMCRVTFDIPSIFKNHLETFMRRIQPYVTSSQLLQFVEWMDQLNQTLYSIVTDSLFDFPILDSEFGIAHRIEQLVMARKSILQHVYWILSTCFVVQDTPQSIERLQRLLSQG